MSIYGNSVGHPLPNPRKGMDMTGSINMNGHQLGGLAEPVKDSDAASKGYVDTAIKGTLTKYMVTLSADGWADNLQKVAVDFATSSNTIFSSPDPDYYDLYTENGVIVTEQDDGSVTFRCKSVPDADIIVNLAIFAEGNGSATGGDDVAITAISVTESADGSVTMVNTLVGGGTETLVISADANGNPSKLTYNGTEIPITWTEATSTEGTEVTA